MSAEFRWMAFGVSLLEILISWKFRIGAGNTIDVDWPLYVSVPWIIIITVCTLYYLYLRFKRDRVTQTGRPDYEQKQIKLINEEKANEKKDKTKKKEVQANGYEKANGVQEEKKKKKKQN